jgi:hypothetical protein
METEAGSMPPHVRPKFQEKVVKYVIQAVKYKR